MQHTHTPALPFEGHNSLWRAVKYLTLALAGLIAILEHSPALLVLVGIAFVLVLALTERARKLESGASRHSQDADSRLIGDGGSFPGARPEQEKRGPGKVSVLDGGCEKHRRS
jgi:hypothetical protein